ncbi:hypothetical protein MVEN_00132800 [Mycena venus]|uniref:Uncharacterized protein n=1 Tax=Mycena venus TaxID=2733690 RepID=A0A8H6Z8R2_9AGAR|nr:hypothetical protein MVEN_00132800 [Mycena venus]
MKTPHWTACSSYPATLLHRLAWGWTRHLSNRSRHEHLQPKLQKRSADRPLLPDVVSGNTPEEVSVQWQAAEQRENAYHAGLVAMPSTTRCRRVEQELLMMPTSTGPDGTKRCSDMLKQKAGGWHVWVDNNRECGQKPPEAGSVCSAETNLKSPLYISDCLSVSKELFPEVDDDLFTF